MFHYVNFRKKYSCFTQNATKFKALRVIVVHGPAKHSPSRDLQTELRSRSSLVDNTREKMYITFLSNKTVRIHSSLLIEIVRQKSSID